MFHRFEVVMFPVVEKPTQKKKLFYSIAPKLNSIVQKKRKTANTAIFFVQNWIKIWSTLYKYITLSFCLYYSDFKR